MKNKWLRFGVGAFIVFSPLLFQAHPVWLIVSGLIGLNVALTGSLVPCPMCSVMNLVGLACGKPMFCAVDTEKPDKKDPL